MAASAAQSRFPRGLVLVTGLLLAAVVLATALARRTEVATARLEVAPPIASRLLTFEDRAHGGVVIREAPGRAIAAVLEPNRSDGFLRGVMRTFARERRMRGVGREPPFLVTTRLGGSVTIEDTATGRTVDLGSFGHNNVAAFARLVDTRGTR
jgi:putative photosynthetic complex assembly protein